MGDAEQCRMLLGMQPTAFWLMVLRAKRGGRRCFMVGRRGGTRHVELATVVEKGGKKMYGFTYGLEELADLFPV